MITLLFSTVGLTFEVKGTVPETVKPDCFYKVEVIGFGPERLNMALIYAIRELNAEEYKNYQLVKKEFNNAELLKKFGAGKGLN